MIFNICIYCIFSIIICIFTHLLQSPFSFSHVIFPCFPIKNRRIYLQNSPVATLFTFCSFQFLLPDSFNTLFLPESRNSPCNFFQEVLVYPDRKDILIYIFRNADSL